MTQLPNNIKAKDLIKALHRLGFEEKEAKGSHVRLVSKNGRWTQVAVHPKPRKTESWLQNVNYR